MNKNVKNLKGKLINRRRNTQVKKVKTEMSIFPLLFVLQFCVYFFISFIAKRLEYRNKYI